MPKLDRCYIIETLPQDAYSADIRDSTARILEMHAIESLGPADPSNTPLLPGEKIQTPALAGDLVEKADLILAILPEITLDSSYLIGYAHALGKMVMFYVSASIKENLPAYLSGYVYRVYEDQQDFMDKLNSDLLRYLER